VIVLVVLSTGSTGEHADRRARNVVSPSAPQAASVTHRPLRLANRTRGAPSDHRAPTRPYPAHTDRWSPTPARPTKRRPPSRQPRIRWQKHRQSAPQYQCHAADAGHPQSGTAHKPDLGRIRDHVLDLHLAAHRHTGGLTEARSHRQTSARRETDPVGGWPLTGALHGEDLRGGGRTTFRLDRQVPGQAVVDGQGTGAAPRAGRVRGIAGTRASTTGREGLRRSEHHTQGSPIRTDLRLVRSAPSHCTRRTVE
jgi:hypothetical protein